MPETGKLERPGSSTRRRNTILMKFGVNVVVEKIDFSFVGSIVDVESVKTNLKVGRILSNTLEITKNTVLVFAVEITVF